METRSHDQDQTLIYIAAALMDGGTWRPVST